MKSLSFSCIINTPVEKVWSTMLDHPTYEQWTEVFSEWSTYQWSWDAWAEIRFVGPSGEWMIAEIAENRLYEYVSIHHKAEIQRDDQKWGLQEFGYGDGGYENYTFMKNSDGTTTLKVDMTNIPDEYVAMFEEIWPEALQILKQLCEK